MGIRTPDCWTPDGREILYETVTANGKNEVWALPLAGERRPQPLLRSGFNNAHSAVSPNGRFIAYASDETGRPEIYVQSFPNPGGKWQVSTAGGDQPQWRRDGKELFYLAADRKLVAVDVRTESSFEVGLPKPLFDVQVPSNGITDFRNQYVPSPDGERFLMTVLVDTGNASPITIVSNWTAEEKK